MALTTTMTPRRSARLGAHCVVATRKRARVSDSEQLPPPSPSSSKLPLTLTPEPSPRWIRAQKRQKILDGSSSPPAIEDPKKRKSLIPDDEPSPHRVIRKKRKENLVNDALTVTAKISISLDTRQAGGNSLHHRLRDEKSADQSHSTRSSASKSKSKSIPKSNSQSKSVKNLACDPSSSSSSPSRMVTRTMKRLSSAPLVPGSTSILPPVIPSSSHISQPTDIQPTSDPTTSSDTQPSLHDTATSTTVTISSSSSTETTPPPLSKSPIDISISMSSLPISFMNVPLSMPLNLAFLNMPLSMPLSMPLNMPISADISTTLAPSESELGFGFHPQGEFHSTAREESKGREKDKEGEEHVFMGGEPPNESSTTRSSPDLSLSSHATSRPSSPLPLPPQSCTPCLNPLSLPPTPIPPRLVISTCVSDQAQPTSTSPTSPTSTQSQSSYSSFVNPTSPTYSSPLKDVCFPPLPAPPMQPPPPPPPFPSVSHWQPSTSASQQLPSVPINGHERRMKEWDTMAMDMAHDQRQTERALEQEMSMELPLSFSHSSTGQGDVLRLAQPQAQHDLVQEQDPSPLLGPAPQPLSPQPQAPFPQLAPSFPSCPPSPPLSSNSSCASSSTSRQYHKKIEYQHHQIPEWTPKLDKERSLWKLACKIRVWEITKRYAPDTIRTVVAQEAHDYYSLHGFPLGYGSRSRRRRWRKMVGGAGPGSTAATAAAGSESDCASSSLVTTPSLSPTRDDEFMSEETYSFELMDDDDEMEPSMGGVSGGVGLGVDGMRSMEDEWRYEGFEDDDELGFEDYDYDDDEEDEEDDIYDEDEEVEVDGNQTKISGNGTKTKKGVQSFTSGEDQDPDAEGEMEIDIEPFQDPSFNAELSSPPSPTGPSAASYRPKSKSKSSDADAAGSDDEPQSFVSSFYIPPVSPHVQHMMQMQQQRQEEQQQLEEPPALASSSSTNPLSPSSLSPDSGMSISTPDTADDTVTAAANNDNNHAPMQIQLPPPSHHPHHYHSQLIPLSSNILPLPPPRLDSVKVFILRQSEMGGLKTTGRGTPADRKRGAIWGGVGGPAFKSGSKRGLDDGKESDSDSDEDGGEDEGGKRGRPRLRLMLSDHDIGSGPRRGSRSRQSEEVNGAKSTLRLSLPCGDGDTDERMMPMVPTGFKCDISESSNTDNDEDIHRTMHSKSSSTSSSTTTTTAFTAADPTWDAFMASLDDKSQQQPQQQQGEEGTFASSVTAADSDGQLLLDLDHDDGHRHRNGNERDNTGQRLGPSSESSSSGMFIFDQGGDDSSMPWFGGVSSEDGVSGGGGSGESVLGGKSHGGVGVGVGGLVGSSGTCPSDALALEGFNFPVGLDGSSTLSYALG